ncbi:MULTISPECIES: restriction endonuclease subunit S [unclassified Sphingobacterium]|uniref:restriction endonuclease subunit S n=1 Tax=unclassified Sphingobacterium TaxID=2609468 RepID=UPI0020C537AD|nr:MULTISPECIES: restriction endonuclease subunit S [unclassified Sphingobacterium]
MQTYDSYKNSGIDWLGEIPSHWELIKSKFINKIFYGDSLNDSQKKKYESSDVTELAYISSKDIDVNYSTINYDNGLRISDFQNFKVAPQKSSLICIEGGSAGRKIAFTKQSVCFVNKLACVNTNNDNNSKFIYYSLKGRVFQHQFKNSLSGLIGGVAISAINNFIYTLPPISEQEAIAAFLDEKCGKIDELVSVKEQQIALLKERRQVVIHEAITKGIQPNVELKDSGIDWIGEIPSHWEVKRLKNILKERNERSKFGNEPLLMMSQTHGLVPRKDFHEKEQVAKTNEGNKIVMPNDLVFNKLKPHLGVFFKNSNGIIGIVSPDYAVYYSKIIYDIKYLEYLFRTPDYIKQFIIKSSGIVEGLVRLYTTELFSLHVALPPYFEQKIILEFIEEQTEKIDQAIALKTEQIEKLKAYKQSLINEVVTGKVKVA